MVVRLSPIQKATQERKIEEAINDKGDACNISKVEQVEENGD